MDYTLSNSYAVDAGTTNRMHLQAQATPTAVSDNDLNMLIWSAMEIVKAAGLAGAPFDKAVPATYQKLLTAMRSAGVFQTAALGDNTTKAATTAFVQAAIGGVLTKSVAGGVTVALTAAEAGNGILIFTGVLTANIAVTVPAAPTRGWIVFNNTTGAFALTVKTPAGTGAVVTQGFRIPLYSDGVNIQKTLTDFDSLALTGTPTAPTPASGDNSTKVATAAFVQAAIGGVLNKSVAGGVTVTLTAAEAGNGILLFTGALTANIAVVVPAAPTRDWIVFNNTTGAYTLTVKTAAGTGPLVTQARRIPLYSDGVNIQESLTDFDSIALTGLPTAPTPAQFDSSTKVATAAFVKAAGSQYGAVAAIAGATTLTAAAHAGNLLTLGGTSYAVTLPVSSTFPSGATLTFLCTATGAVTLNRAGTDTVAMGSGAAQTSIAMAGGDTLTLVSNGAGVWSAEGGSAQLKYAPGFASSIAGAGWKKYPDPNSPSGFVIHQWGVVSAVAGADVTTSYPIAFPAAVLTLHVSGDYTPGSGGQAYYSAATNSLASFVSRASAAVGARFFAIGY